MAQLAAETKASILERRVNECEQTVSGQIKTPKPAFPLALDGSRPMVHYGNKHSAAVMLIAVST